jgi:hypothetical protein
MDRRVFFIRCLLVLLLLAGGMASAEDFKLSDGTVLRGVRVKEVRPDALVVEHEKGVAMAELEKLPRAVRVRYSYDARKAATFRKQEAEVRRATAEENRRLVAAHERRKREINQAEWEAPDAAGAPSGTGGEIRFAPRLSASERAFSAGVAGIGREIAKAEEARIEADAPVTFWTAPFWKSPVMRVLGALLGGAGGGRSEPFHSEPRNWQ